jgi:cytoskeletal protein RodZ
MATFGEKLRSAREESGIGLDEIAAATKISPRYLDALERDDFEHLPGDVFTKGFVRAYAGQIGLDPDGLVEEFERERAGRAGATPREDDGAVLREMSRLLADREDGDATGRRRRTVAWIVGCLVVVAAAVVWMAVRVAPTTEDTRADRPERQTVSDDVRETPPATRADVPAEVAQPPEPIPERLVTPAPAPVVESVVQPEDVDAGRVTVPEFAVGEGVVNREIVGAGDRFMEGQQVWFWTRVVGGRAGETLRHVWIHEGQEITTVELKLGGPHWRTQSRKTLRPGSAGSWAVEARDADGHVLARREFVCEPGVRQ